MPASIDFVEKFLLERQVSARKYQEIMLQLKKFSTANLVLSDQDLMIVLEDMAPDLIEEAKKNEEGNCLPRSIYPVRDYIPKLQLFFIDEQSWWSRLLSEARQIMVVAQQIPNGTYPPKSAERVDVKIYENRILVYSVQVMVEEMLIGYGSLILAVSGYVKTLRKRRQRRAKKILIKFCDNFFSQENLAKAAHLEALRREK
ncbi:hypothetical protein L6270_00130 [Candidatus Parcubacteria bacterium]|nr:hypothetical protein [Patescibacteria group bacterium]MBU4309562.1 hypothetical protein [Patescibacteria group bacterium]MBU4432348.1 hypothetical protein [Patescibacteria group bacterium]MBU4578050.1 hypothetical protein [Patescibacteria group bacterium]MCG2696442.1 hypothetical protein [Candidatus Parcubacteria bacterium]